MTHSVNLSVIEQGTNGRAVNADLLRELFYNRAIETPVMTLSRSKVVENIRSLQDAMPRVNIHYAVKPNAHPLILQEVHANGGNFDVCSQGEIEQVLQTGVDPSTLIHSHPIKSLPEFDYAVGAGIETFVVDNPEEIKKFARYTDRKLKVLIRFRIHTNTTAVVNLQYKFGCLEKDVLPLARMIRMAGHDFYGLCFHIGSQCVYSENYVRAIKAAQSLIRRLDAEGFNTRLLDIGGGFPVEYVEPMPSIAEFCKPIAQTLDKCIRPGIQIVSEPGRFIAATPVTLACTVIGKSERDGKIWYYLDDGLYSTFSGILYDHCQYPVVTDRDGDGHVSVLSGPTCDSFDVMYDGLMIPEHNVGDRMLFTDTGAYCAVSGSSFNALKRPDYMVVD